jgi:hypothetical protein
MKLKLIWVVYGKTCYLYFFDRKNDKIFPKTQPIENIKKRKEAGTYKNRENETERKD